jgi:hypothetical protein
LKQADLRGLEELLEQLPKNMSVSIDLVNMKNRHINIRVTDEFSGSHLYYLHVSDISIKKLAACLNALPKKLREAYKELKPRLGEAGYEESLESPLPGAPHKARVWKK